MSECDIISPFCCPTTWATIQGNNPATILTKKEQVGNKKRKEKEDKIKKNRYLTRKRK